ncbi:MAG: DUF4838 domain-containing protein [Oscillospiraceae bacterium]|nr:DUF4838 domain-containing protein [Oscillospiraceae bacterium]
MFFLGKGINDCKIAIPKDAHVIEKTASEELCNYIEKTLSISLPIVSENEASGKCIYVGHTEYAKKNGILGKSKENWIMKMADGNLVLTGGVKTGDRGIIYSVYHFLEDIVGVRWWNPYEEDVPSLDSLSIADDFYKEGTPHFVLRKPIFNRPLGAEEGVRTFSHIARTRTNMVSEFDDDVPDGAYNPEIRKFGDVAHYGRPHHCHVMGKLFPKDETYDEHPEWFAWNKAEGKRIKDGHRCFSNEEFVKTVIEKLLKTIEEDVVRHEKEGTELPYCYAISPDDIPGTEAFCQCPECEKIIEKAGYGGYCLRFINRIAREVRKVYPFAKIEHLAYFSFIEPACDGTLPESNVVVRLANIYVDVLRDIDSVSNRRYKRLLAEWSEVCKRAGSELHVWEYMFNMRLNYPLPIFYRMQDTIKAFEAYGVKGVFVEIEEHLSDMWELNKYVLSHLLEEPDSDIGVMVKDFTDRYYGAAGSFVREYLELLKRTSEKHITTVYCCLEDSPFNYIDAECAIKASEILDRAEKAIGDATPYRARLDWLRKSLDSVILTKYNDLRKTDSTFEFDTDSLRARVVLALSEYAKLPLNLKHSWRVPIEEAYFKSLPFDEKKLEIPEIFKGENEADIYQFPISNMFGFAGICDELSASGSVVKLTPEIAAPFGWGIDARPTSKYAEHPRGVKFSLYQNEKTVAELSLYKEDFANDGYRLYKIGTVQNISSHPDTALVFYVMGAVSISLSALSVTFPMEECDVYLSLCAKGELYGGDPSDENAIYFDRMIVVRKNV